MKVVWFVFGGFRRPWRLFFKILLTVCVADPHTLYGVGRQNNAFAFEVVEAFLQIVVVVFWVNRAAGGRGVVVFVRRQGFAAMARVEPLLVGFVASFWPFPA